MNDIRDKIAKLLALADNPNENEAKAALLKARELMAKHKLSPDEIKRAEKSKVIVQTVGVFCTKMTDTWAVNLSAIIAKHYCCKAYRHHVRNAKKVEIGFAGLEDDYEICKQIFLYAYDCVKSRCREIKAEHLMDSWYSGTDIREMCNAYGWGFCRGLQVAYLEQEQQHQEWGLVMVVPQEVNEATASHGKPSSYGEAHTDGWRSKYAAAGYTDGQKFDPAHRLEEWTYLSKIEKMIARGVSPILVDWIDMCEKEALSGGADRCTELLLKSGYRPDGSAVCKNLREQYENGLRGDDRRFIRCPQEIWNKVGGGVNVS